MFQISQHKSSDEDTFFFVGLCEISSYKPQAD